MALLSRYLLRQLAAPFLFALGALTSMLLLNQIAKRFGDLVGKGLPPAVIAEVLLLSLPFIVALTLPMAILVAVLYAFSHLAADNEITAMRANGISVAQLLRPVLVAGALLTAVNFLFIDQVLPRSNARLRNLTADIGRKKPTLQLREQAVNDLPPTSYVLRAGRIEQYTGRLRDVTIYDLSLPTARRIIYADSGMMAFEEGERDLQMRLFDGEVHEYRPEEQGVVRVTAFEHNTIRARDVSNALEFNTSQFERGDREMSTCEMMDRAALAEAWAVRARALRAMYTRQDLRSILRLAPESTVLPPEPDALRYCGPWRRIERFLGRFIFPSILEAQAPAAGTGSPGIGGPVVRAPPPRQGLGPINLVGITAVSSERERWRSEVRAANTYQVEIHKKFTISVSCLNFVLIGIALALRFPRGGVGLVIGGSLVVFAFFYVCLTAGEGLADRNLITPAMAMWFPNLLLAIAGLAGLRVVSRESGSTRGGDLADLRDQLFGWLLPRRRA
ncbi:MAG TPA: LptF/LptG family permease [Gemmatimonadales bacterium]